MDCELAEPTIDLKSEFSSMAEEFREEGTTRYVEAVAGFDSYVQTLHRNQFDEHIPANRVPQTTYWLISEDRRILGTVDLRHRLMPHLRKEGGHIGYDIRPSERRKGYGTEILRLILEKAKKMGLTWVLITCDKDNIGSMKIIEKNGGNKIGEDVSDHSGKEKCHYRIELA